MDVGLSKFDRINVRGSRDNWDQLGRHLFGRSSSGLPPLLPPCPFLLWQVCVPARRQHCILWIRHHRNQPTQITDQCHLEAKLRTRMIGAWQTDVSWGNFSDELAFGISAQGKKGSHVAERGQILVLISA